MPVRLLKPYNGQAANSVYGGVGQATLLATGAADTQVELADDYAQESRTVTDATANALGANRVYLMNSGSGQTLTIGLQGGVPLQTVITVIQMGAGKTTIAAASGVTINTSAATLLTSGQYAVAQLIMTTRNTWIAFGGLGG